MPHRLAMRWPAAGRLRRPLHLIIAACVAAAGLCLVVGMIALIVWVGAKPARGRFAGQPNELTPVSSRAVPRLSLSPNGHGEVAHAKVVHSYQGTGPGRRGPFRIRRPGRWGLLWAFSCGTGQDGRFLVTGHSPVTSDDVVVAATGPAARGVSWAAADPGRLVLIVHSRCSWQIRVLRPAD